MPGDAKKKIRCAFVAAGKYHDIDFARLEVLKLLAEDDRIRTRVFEDYSNLAAIREADFLITYTCDVIPRLDEQEALRAYVEGGGRWYALHGTNSILRFLANGKVDSPRWAPHFMETLGSQFVAHPPIRPYTVQITQPDHPLVKGVKPFETTDEEYLVETYGDLDVMLHTDFEGEATGFIEDKWEKRRHPIFYEKKIAKGSVLYLTLGHCRGHYDMQPLMDYYPQIERCAWDLPVYYDLLRRGIAWAKEPALA
jgi:type 1 glutamine amidotransferase